MQSQANEKTTKNRKGERERMGEREGYTEMEMNEMKYLPSSAIGAWLCKGYLCSSFSSQLLCKINYVKLHAFHRKLY